MFTNRPNGVIGSGDGAVPVDATYELVLHAQQAVHELWNQRRADICSSPARPDLQMDKEEGVGYLLGDILRGVLLPIEARTIGKRAGKLATKAKGELESAKAKAKVQRSRVRAAAAKDANLAASLDDAVATIDADATVVYTTILATVCASWACPYQIRLCGSALSEPKPRSDVDELTRLRAQVAKNEAASTLADADATASRRCCEKAQDQMSKLQAKRMAQSSGCCLEH